MSDKNVDTIKEVKVAFIGFGNSARRLAEMLIEKESEIANKYKVKISCTAIATARHASVISKEKIDLSIALAQVKAGNSLKDLPEIEIVTDTFQAIKQSHADIIIETTLLSIQNGEPARSHIEEALRAGKHVVTANKGPLAFAADELTKLAEKQNCLLRYESTMMDGTPVFNLVRYTLPLVKINRIKGIVNSTTNFILTEMEAGRDFQTSLIEAQRRGIAEADASLDIDGWDAAAKASVLANCLMNAKITPMDVFRKGIASIKQEEILNAQKADKKIRLVMQIERNKEGVKAEVLPMEIDKDDIFYNIDAFSNILLLETDLMGTLAIIEQNPELTQTAYGLLSDLLSVINDRFTL
jgi:homoserine dehydrogenase